MKVCYAIIISVIVFCSCGGEKVPDVSEINVSLNLQRFEKDLFAVDSINLSSSLQQLQKKYPVFLQDFIYNILALNPHPDSAGNLQNQMLAFISSYQPMKDTADKVFGNFEETTNEIRRSLQFVKYYFPEYQLPSKLITFIGPIDSYGNILTTDALAVGLQLYMGSSYTLYQSEAFQQLYPAYISRRFSKEYIPVNTIKTIVDDIFPDNNAGRPLIEQMIQAGKRLYVLDKLMPETEDSLLTGYTGAQLKGAFDNEETIWSFFVQNDLLFTNDPAIVKDYMNDAPKTQAFGDASPGFIGQFVGWQIVKKYKSNNPEMSLQELINTDPKTIFEQAKYKP